MGFNCVNIVNHYKDGKLSAITVNNKKMEVNNVKTVKVPNERQADGTGVPPILQMFSVEEETQDLKQQQQQEQKNECRARFETQRMTTNVKGLECYSMPEMEW